MKEHEKRDTDPLSVNIDVSFYLVWYPSIIFFVVPSDQHGPLLCVYGVFLRQRQRRRRSPAFGNPEVLSKSSELVKAHFSDNAKERLGFRSYPPRNEQTSP